eukprot:3483116-Rhodomonas_salina.1
MARAGVIWSGGWGSPTQHCAPQAGPAALAPPSDPHCPLFSDPAHWPIFFTWSTIRLVACCPSDNNPRQPPSPQRSSRQPARISRPHSPTPRSHSPTQHKSLWSWSAGTDQPVFVVVPDGAGEGGLDGAGGGVVVAVHGLAPLGHLRGHLLGDLPGLELRIQLPEALHHVVGHLFLHGRAHPALQRRHRLAHPVLLRRQRVLRGWGGRGGGRGGGGLSGLSGLLLLLEGRRRLCCRLEHLHPRTAHVSARRDEPRERAGHMQQSWVSDGAERRG